MIAASIIRTLCLRTGHFDSTPNMSSWYYARSSATNIKHAIRERSVKFLCGSGDFDYASGTIVFPNKYFKETLDLRDARSELEFDIWGLRNYKLDALAGKLCDRLDALT